MESSRVIRFKNLVMMMLLFVAQGAFAQSVIGGSAVVVGGNPGLQISGGWPNSCIPESVSITRSGLVLTAEVSTPPGVLVCFSAFRDWQVAGPLPQMPAGLYQVNVVTRFGTEPAGTLSTIGTFNISLPASNGVQAFSVPTLSRMSLMLMALGLLMMAMIARRKLAMR